ncbi:unnamed protein product, partial [Discosporangium mesarthrocarpum]
ALRENYGFILRKRTTFALLAFICTVGLVITLVLQETVGRYRPSHSGACHMFMEWKFLLPFCILQTLIFGVLGKVLVGVDDLLNISSELRVNFMAYLVFAFPYFVVLLNYWYRR